MIADLHEPEDRERDPDVARTARPCRPARRRASVFKREPADPRLNAEPAARDQRAQHRRHVRALHAEARAAQHGKRHAVLRAGVRVEDHRHQHDRVAEQDGEHRLPPRHALLHQAGRERVGRDDHAHADPERGDVIGGPGAARERRRREVGIPERACREILVELDEVASAVGTSCAHALRLSAAVGVGAE